MKNIITPELIAAFSKKPIPFKEISDFLDAHPEVIASHLCKALGFSVGRLYNWKYRNKISSEKKSNKQESTITPVNSDKKRYSPEERYGLVSQYNKLSADKQSEFLRKYGLYQSDINRWSDLIQEAAIAALSTRKTRSDKKPAEQVELEDLKKKLAIQDKKITKLDALLGIQKKVLDILGTDKDE